MQPSRFVQELIDIVGERNVLWDDYDLRLYEYDGSVDRALPQAVVLPESAEQVAEIVKLCNRAAVPYTARASSRDLGRN